MEQNKTNQQNELFHIGKDSNKDSLKVDSRIQNRTNQFLNNQDADQLKKNLSEHNEASRKEIKNQKFTKNRNCEAKDQSETDNIKDILAEKTEHTITQAQSLWDKGIDFMDYYLFLNNTKFEITDSPFLQELIKSDKDHNILLAVVGLRKLLSLVDNPPRQCVVDADLLPQLITLTNKKDVPKIQFEALWCLTNIACGKAEHVETLVDKGIIPILTSLLRTTQDKEDETKTYPDLDPHKIVEQSIWALGNIAVEDAHYKAKILKEGALKQLGNILQKSEPNSGFTRNCMWCIRNLLRNKPFPKLGELFYLIPIISECLKTNDKNKILTDGIWALYYISEVGEKTNTVMIQCGLIEILKPYLKHSDNNIVLRCVRIFGNFVLREENETQAVIDAGVLPHLHDLLSHQDNTIVKKTCWMLSNICAGPTDHISALIKCGTIDKLIELIEVEEYEIGSEAGWCISHAIVHNNAEIVEKIVSKKGIEAMCYLLKSKIKVKAAIILLEGIKICLNIGQQSFINEEGFNEFALIFENCGGLDTIEKFYAHEDHLIYQLAEEIIESYFLVGVNLDDDEVDITQQF
ncbi:unnamed protein product [Moneuplotes crassus]|uniref:Importin subunit alpha n=1 Tax=Euplotes crassus TaxID=5936 RepID=A0AAD1UCQ2_EUPCR|nr:unnamed protein product [Moneuplotes crassus]